MLETPDTRASRRAATAAASAAPSRRRIAGIAVIAAVLGAALIAALFQAPAALAAWAAPSEADVRHSAEIAEDAGIALTNAQALNNVVAASPLTLEAAQTAVEFADLKVETKTLADVSDLSADELAAVVARAEKETTEVRAATATLRAALTDAKKAEAARIAAEKARKAAEEAARKEAERKAAAAALAAANTVEGAKATARSMAADRYGWGDGQFSCLSSLWNKVSSWNCRACVASSGATGIPQALPGSKMASAGGDWRTNAATQISWGLDYIARAYGSPCSAWGHSQAVNWY